MSYAKRVAWATAALLGLSVTAVTSTAFAAGTPTPIIPGQLPPAGNVEAGAQKAAVCTACHGPNGNSANPEWPSLSIAASYFKRYSSSGLRKRMISTITRT